MKTITTTRQISAPIEVVFETISDVRNFSKAVPDIVDIEFLTDQQVGPGTKFKETRVMNGRKATVELQVAEYVKDEKVRMISDAGGTVWDTIFTVTQAGGLTEMKMAMEARPYKLLARIMTPLMRGMVAHAVESDMDRVKSYCESQVNTF